MRPVRVRRLESATDLPSVCCLVLTLVLGCTPGASTPSGKWVAANSPDFRSVEFFPDKTAHILDARNLGFAGTWSELPDGRLKLETVAAGSTIQLLGSYHGDSLVVEWQGNRNVFVREGDGEAPAGSAAGTTALPSGGAASTAQTDNQRIASLKTDLRNMMTAQEAYFSDFRTYGSLAQLQKAANFTLSSGNTGTAVGSASGFTGTVSNTSITTGPTRCTVQVGAGAASTIDGVIVCPQ